MKQFKNAIYFIFALTVIIGCEKETSLLENSEITNQQDPKSVIEIIELGIDLESYFKSIPKQESLMSRIESQEEHSGLQFFSSPEEFECIDLSMEDFEEGRGNSVGFPSPLNEASNNAVFESGEILQGISFSTNNDANHPLSALAFFDAFGAGNNDSKIIVANYFTEYLVIDFDTNDVTSISMDVIAWQDRFLATTIDVYGFSGLLGQTIVDASSSGVYLAINSDEPIAKITLNSYGGAEGVDNISFGSCDSDEDGVPNGDDPFPYSNLSEEVSIDGCYPNIENIFVVPGATMMDYIDEIINNINAQYNGDNWEELNSEFSQQMAVLTSSWKADRLISRRERSIIYRCVGNATIPRANE